MIKPLSMWSVAGLMVAAVAQAQPAAKVQRIGVIYDAGFYGPTLQGLRAGLKDHGLVEGRNFVLHLRDTRGDVRHIEETAKQLASEQVDVLFTVTTSVTTLANKVTSNVPIVFYAGNDPVRAGLIQSFAKPGGRLTGVHHRRVELVPKRMEMVRQILPKVRRVISFYDPTTATSREAAVLAGQAAERLGIQLVQRQVTSAEQLVAGVRALRPGEVDAYFLIGDPTATAATLQILPLALERKLPVIVHDMSLFDAGALAAYGANYFDIGRMAAKHVKLILGGARPGDVPVETYEKVQLAVNLRVAKQLGLTIPDPVILRADQVIR